MVATLDGIKTKDEARQFAIEWQKRTGYDSFGNPGASTSAR